MLFSTQVDKPQMYINPDGIRFTRAQFDSISSANKGKAIAVNDRIEIDKEVLLTFEILTVNPFQEFFAKWIGQSFPNFQIKGINGMVYYNSSLLGKVVVLTFGPLHALHASKRCPHLMNL